MKVLKFGGTSVGTPAAIRAVVAIARRALLEGPAVVVVSAFGGVTNQLLTAVEAASRRDEGYEEIFAALRLRHLDAAAALAGDEADALGGRVDALCVELRERLRGAYLLREASPRARDGIASFGERLSAEIVAAAFRAAGQAARAIDAREVVLTDASFGRAQVDLTVSYARIREAVAAEPGVAIFTGFIGATADGITTTLGRGGSDYSGALVGAALGASAIEIWTDVDGVLTADPRVVPGAFPQPAMSYAELMELSHFGAKVVYPPSIHPARALGIPLWIRNTFNADHPGTVVLAEARPATTPIRGISSIGRVALARLEGDGMVGVPGIAQRLFGALAREAVSAILISQSSSEHSICFAVTEDDAGRARTAVEREFALEIEHGLIDRLVIELGQSVIAAVGAQMARRPGIAGRVFGVLGAHDVNVRAIAQGSSELNISLVVAGSEEKRAVNALHGAFFTPDRRRVDVALLGVGGVGAALLAQLTSESGELAAREGIDIRLVALADSRRLVLDAEGIDLATWRERLAGAPPLDRQALLDHLGARRGAVRVCVDCTAAVDLAPLHVALLAAGVAVVAANKKPFAGPWAEWQALHAAARSSSAPLIFETTVGAGLPVLSTLTDLRRTGDVLHILEGVLSGTVNAVLDHLGPETSFSQAVRAAFDAGLTEPNPYDDLSGADVRRKLCILARVAGRAIELDEVAVEPLLPAAPWAMLALPELWRRLPNVDAEFESRRRQAADRGCRLRYLATLDESGARVGLAEVSADHSAFDLRGPDNLVALRTARYAQRPLVVRGPGAGQVVTAAAVFADILHAVDRLDRAHC
jgi:aspartokinase/homoserine dehydrogenase 1